MFRSFCVDPIPLTTTKWFVVMRRAKADDSFTWQPFDHGRQHRVAALVAVGLCSGIVGLAVGRVSSGTSVENKRAPALQSGQTAVTTPVAPPVGRLHPDNEMQTARAASREVPSRLQRERPDAPTPAPTAAKNYDQSLPPALPPVVLLNPDAGKQTAAIGENKVPREARSPLHRERSDTPVPATAVAKKNDLGVPFPNEAPEVGQLPREQTRPHRAHVSIKPGRSKEPRAFSPERPATLADYRALRDYMMGH